MIRVMVKWDFVSPSLQVASGIAEVHYTEHISKWELLAKFRVKGERGCIGYKSLDGEGIPTIILDAVKPYIDILIKTYLEGVMLDKSGSFFWLIPEELNMARDSLDKLNKKIEAGEYILEQEISEIWRI